MGLEMWKGFMWVETSRSSLSPEVNFLSEA